MDLGSLEEKIRDIRLNIHQPNGQLLRLGHRGPTIDWFLHTGKTLNAICKQPDPQLGRSYVRGDWDTDTGWLSTLITELISADNRTGLLHTHPGLQRLRARLPRFSKDPARSQWQDISHWLSRICLGDTLFHGCAYYPEAGTTTEQAQRLSLKRLSAQMQFESHHHILDLNAGWGSLPLQLAETLGVRVTALVSSREQLRFAQSEARRRGLDARLHFRLSSFHQVHGRFDRVLASGFLEQFSESAYPVLFARIESLLHEEGLAWLQTAGRGPADGLGHSWHRQQLPARHSLPLLSDICRGVEQGRLRQLQVEDNSQHWLQDLQTRARRFRTERRAICERFGETRTRHWEFLLACQVSAVQRGQLKQYDILLGQPHCHWPVAGIHSQQAEVDLPSAITRQVPGLTAPLKTHQPSA